MSTDQLQQAKRNKKDEFYTTYEVIEDEVMNYTKHFENASIFCNCDDPTWSNFWEFFHTNFHTLGLRRLVSTHYKYDGSPSYSLTYEGGNDLDVNAGIRSGLKGNGDFRSDECIELLKQADIVITNPPFSLFREYVAQLMKYDKKFIIIGNINAVTYKEFFPFIKEDKVWIGESIHSGDRKFGVPDDYPLNAAGCGIDEDGTRWIRVKGVRWFTNIEVPYRGDEFFPREAAHVYYEGHEDDYPKYDNYDAIEVRRTNLIPIDYTGVMGVPITFLDKYNPKDFELVGADFDLAGSIVIDGKCKLNPQRMYVNGKRLYSRILIRNKHPRSRAEDEAM